MRKLELQDFLDHVNRGALIEGGSEQHRFMQGASQEALRIVAGVPAKLIRMTGFDACPS